MKCRNCKSESNFTFLDLGYAPPSNAYLNSKPVFENYYPLKTMVCNNCYLVQTSVDLPPTELFTSEYAYLSSTSSSWLKHSKKFSDDIIDRLQLDNSSFVIEIACNDGYLLKNFIEKGINCLGIEPTEGAAAIAKDKGISVITEFFGLKLAKKISNSFPKANLICANNVLAHVPDINDFVSGISYALSDNGTVTVEFPHLYRLIKGMQFDTIYHEHFSYLSLKVVNDIFKKNRLKIYDIDELDTHGGSLRVYASHDNFNIPISKSVNNILNLEKEYGMFKMDLYLNFSKSVKKIKFNINRFISSIILENKSIGGYGAAAKGNTLLNYLGITNDAINFVCDNSIFKQGKLLPGSHIIIKNHDFIYDSNPDYLIIFPWNIADEIIQNIDRKKFTGKIVTLIPDIKVF